MSDLGNKQIMGENIQYSMDKYGKSRNDLCKDLGIKYTTLTDWIKGNSYPRIDKIELMANYFGIEKSDLVEKHTENKEWQPTLTEKDEKDIQKQLEKITDQLDNSTGLMFDGEAMDENTKALLKDSLEFAMRNAKMLAKEKYTPKKYRK